MSDDAKFFTDGAGYERLMGRWSRHVGDIFLDWLAVPTGMHWLDVGCGNGAFTETIIAHCSPAEVHGVDPSEAQIAYARSRDNGERAQFHIGDALSLPFDNDRFDVAAMALVISFVPDAARAVSEMVRVVRSGGLVANYMWDIPAGGLPLTPVRKAFQALGLATPPAPPGAEVSRLEGMQKLWWDVGLDAVEGRRIDFEVTFADFDDFWQSNTGPGSPIAPLLRTVSATDVERVRDRLRESLPQDVTGRIRYGAPANAVKGVVPG
jgi:SAM-dependent methyltransferase